MRPGSRWSSRGCAISGTEGDPAGLAEALAADRAFHEQFAALIRLRRDVRAFRSDPIPNETLNRWIALAHTAPSVGAAQPWRFVIVETPARRARIQEIFATENAAALNRYDGERAATYARLKLEGLTTAPVQIAVFSDAAPIEGHGLGRQTMPETLPYSTICAIHTLWLAARAEGVGLGWVSILDPAAVCAALDAAPDWRLIAYLCLGRPAAEDFTPALERAGWQDRRPLDEVVIVR